jgi:hypothetical protein
MEQITTEISETVGGDVGDREVVKVVGRQEARDLSPAIAGQQHGQDFLLPERSVLAQPVAQQVDLGLEPAALGWTDDPVSDAPILWRGHDEDVVRVGDLP